MTGFLDKKRQQNKEAGNTPVKAQQVVKSVSEHKADAPAYGTTPTLIRMNQYHKDLVKFTAEKLQMSGAEVIRVAIREYALKNGVV